MPDFIQELAKKLARGPSPARWNIASDDSGLSNGTVILEYALTPEQGAMFHLIDETPE